MVANGTKQPIWICFLQFFQEEECFFLGDKMYLVNI
jgi:hypothetical protein